MNLHSPFLDTWVAMALFTIAIDAVMLRRRLSGKLGKTMQAEYQETRRRMGSQWHWVLLVLGDLFLWPLTLILCLYGYLHALKARQRELDAEARARAVAPLTGGGTDGCNKSCPPPPPDPCFGCPVAFRASTPPSEAAR